MMQDKKRPLLLSVIMPVYNYAEKVSDAINSVLCQMDNARHELIIVNDGSTDNSQLVLEQLKSATDKKFLLINKENGGAASARNLGIKSARGRFYLFLDADDRLESDALSIIEQHLELHAGTEFVIGGYTSVWPEVSREKISIPSFLPEDAVARVKAYLIEKKLSLVNGATVFHYSIFAKGLYPENFRNAEDMPVFAQALANKNCSLLKQKIVRIYKSTKSLRHNTDYDRQVGFDLVNEIFHSGRLSSGFLVLESKFFSQRALSLFRGFYTAGLYAEAKAAYRQAIRADLSVVLNMSYTRKILRILFKN